MASLGSDAVIVSKLLIHPIKSCKGTSMQEVDFTPQGVQYDRNWSIVDVNKSVVLTIREVPRLVLVHPQIKVDKSAPGEGTMTVSFPPDSGVESFEVPLFPDASILKEWKTMGMKIFTTEIDGYIAQTAPTKGSPSEILSRFLEREVHLVFKGPKPRPCEPTSTHPELVVQISQQDGYPMLVLAEESVSKLESNTRPFVGEQGVEEKWKDEKLVIERFRPNIIIKGAGAFTEDTWGEMIIEPAGADERSNPSIELVSRCTRCLLPNVDPATGIRDKAVPYKIMMKSRAGLAPEAKRSPCMGVNGVPSGNGRVRVGDRIKVTKLAPAIVV